MAKTILCLVHDDRQGRKGGVYGQTADYVQASIKHILPQL